MLNRLAGFWAALRPNFDDDSVDRLNYLYTNLIILAFAITVAAKQYGGWEQYVENYCFVENTFWLPMAENIPEDVVERENRELPYYQWVPFVLALQAFMFYVPRMMWSMMNWHSGMQVSAIIKTALQTTDSGDAPKLKNKKDFESGVHQVAVSVRDAVDYHRESGAHRSNIGRYMSKGMGVYVTCLYLFMKVLYIVNVLAQFLILNAFLGPQYTWWGIGILRDIMNGVEWETSGHFPRVTMCDFVVRRLGNLHRWTVQCVLMINMVNEKIYLFLWWWFLLVAIISILNLMYWLMVSIVPSLNVQFVERYLRYKGVISNSAWEKERVRKFVTNRLRRDGVTVLRLLSDNAGDVVACEVIVHLYKSCYPDEPAIGPAPPSTDTTTSTPVKGYSPIDGPDEAAANQGFTE